MNNGHPKHIPREIELDFLRGIAILAVVDFHSKIATLSYPLLFLGFPKLGWLGVRIFFILSGFLVGGLLMKEWKSKGLIDGKRFLIRRAFKIWPQYYVFILLITVTGHHSLGIMWGSFVHLQNYFIGVPHLWTLAVEEHAYLLLAVLLTFASKQSVGIWKIFASLAVTSLLVAVSRWLSYKYEWPYLDGTHNNIDGIFWGVMLAFIYHYKAGLFQKLQSMRWLWIAIFALTLSQYRFNWLPQLAGLLDSELPNLFSISLFMLVYRHQPGRVYHWLYKLVAWIGLYSYGIYLWHVSTAALVFKSGHLLPGAFSTAWIAIAQPISGILLGIITTKLIEFPMLRLRERLFPAKIPSADVGEFNSVTPAS